MRGLNSETLWYYRLRRARSWCLVGMQIATTVVVHVHIMTRELLFPQTNVNHIMNITHPLGKFFL